MSYHTNYRLRSTKNLNVAALLILLFSASWANGGAYNVTNAAANCRGAAHGLWTNSDRSDGRCSNYFSIDGLFTIHDSGNTDQWYAQLDAKARNPQGVEADISLVFSDWLSDYNYKRENGAPYDTNNVDFFSSVSGEIVVETMAYDVDSYAGGYAFQYGQGANAKNANAFGGSAWIRSCQDGIDGDCFSSHHWDLNLDLTPVPIPGSLLLFGSALVLFGSIKTRSKRKT